MTTALDAPPPALVPAAALLDRIGGTPLLRLPRLGPDPRTGVEVLVKAEHLNPSGSGKDRAARAMILEAAAAGRLTRERILLDATSGNAGIAYAMLGAALGYRVALCLPANATPERKRLLRLHGATLIETDPGQGSDGARRRAEDLVRAEPERYCHLNQYDNDANWRAHRDTTAPELWAQTGGRITHFLAGLGTSGTFVGTARGLRAVRPELRAIALQPDEAEHRLVGLKHLASARRPGIYDPGCADEEVVVSTAQGQAMARRLAREEGLLVGPSSGANVFAALRMAPALAPGSVLVTVLFDTGARYLSAEFWD